MYNVGIPAWPTRALAPPPPGNWWRANEVENRNWSLAWRSCPSNPWPWPVEEKKERRVWVWVRCVNNITSS